MLGKRKKTAFNLAIDEAMSKQGFKFDSRGCCVHLDGSPVKYEEVDTLGVRGILLKLHDELISCKVDK